jgi:phosphatidate cytidylyltransferase
MNRIIPGILLAAGWLTLLLLGSFAVFWLTVVIICLIAAYEFLRMVLPQGTENFDFLLLSLFISIPAILTGLWQEDGLGGGLFLSAFLLVCYILVNYSRLADSFQILSRLVFGALYVGFFSAHLVLLHLLPEGKDWLVILVAITAGSDSGAYYSGRLLGKHKLCKNISPNKTIEGAVGGMICGLVIAIVSAFLLLDSIDWLVLIPVSLVLVAVGIMGDLCESIVKRGTKTKDSGTILLGHGGILDRIDSLILTAPFLYYLRIFTG